MERERERGGLWRGVEGGEGGREEERDKEGLTLLAVIARCSMTSIEGDDVVVYVDQGQRSCLHHCLLLSMLIVFIIVKGQ